MATTKTTKPTLSTAESMKRAARHLDRAAEALKAAHAELTPNGDELPFSEQVAEQGNDVARVAERLKQYAANGW